MRVSAIVCLVCLIASMTMSVHAGAAEYVSPVDGLSFDYNDKEWILYESAISNRVVLHRISKRGDGRIIIGHRAPSGHTIGNTRNDITVEREGQRYVVSCTASMEDFMFALFSCNELARKIEIKRSHETDAATNLDMLPSYQSRTTSVLDLAMYALLSGAEGCSDMSAAIHAAAQTSSPTYSTRLNVISDLIRGRVKLARSSATKLVDQDGTSMDFVLLGLASQSRADRRRWRAAYARGRARGSLIDYWQGVVALKEQRIQDAAMFFERAFEKTSSDLAAAKMAEIALNVGDMKGARRWWKAMDDRSILKAALTIWLAYQDGAHEDALWVYDQFDGGWCGELGARAATNAARSAYAKGERDHARRLLKQAIAYNEAHASAYKILARIAVEDGHGDEDVARILKRYLPYARGRERQRLLGVIDDM